jgi:pyruvate kinase
MELETANLPSDEVVARLQSIAGRDHSAATRAEVVDLYAALLRSHDAMVSLLIAAKSQDPVEWIDAARAVSRATRAIGEGASRFAGKDGDDEQA